MSKMRCLFASSLVLLVPCLITAQQLICDNRTPDGYSSQKTDGDGGFSIVVTGPEAPRGKYVPNEVYTVTIQGLRTRYRTLKFTEFLLVAESQKQLMMGQTGLITTGIFHITDDAQSRYSDFCPDAVTNSDLSPKSEVAVLWTAPSTLVASCITFKTTIVERPDFWYMDEGHLTTTLCPYIPAPEPTLPERRRHGNSRENGTRRKTTLGVDTATPSSATEGKCCACDDAKYEVVFEGLWSKETHPKDFPENAWLLHFSDIIGASHSKDFYFWKEGEMASEGIRHVAEWGATRHLENELKRKSKSINTIIKARGLWHPNEKGATSAAFRVDKERHVMSLVSMLGPSPDWIVGISGYDLCLPDCTWKEEISLDLYPYDAGTDDGISYMSPNSPTEPQEPIRALNSSYPDDPKSPFWNEQNRKMKPLARALIRRQRIYPKSCDSNSNQSDVYHEVIFENTEETNRPECNVTAWTEWSDCSVACGKGLRMRKRNYANPMKANMMNCDRQLVEKEMCLGQVPTCDQEADVGIEEMDTICALSDWSEWSPCSVTCGKGYQRRTRAYKNPMGRKKCYLETVQTADCEGKVPTCDPARTTSKPDPECPLSPWSEWSPCSVSCGKGFQERRRLFLISASETVPDKCSNITLAEKVPCTGPSGQDCSISLSEAKELCMMSLETGPCRGSVLHFGFVAEKGMCVPFEYGGCKGNRNRFENETTCMQVCGFLAHSDTSSNALGELRAEPNLNLIEDVSHSIIVASTTPSLYTTTTSTSTSTSEATTTKLPEKVDCEMSDWSGWSQCSVPGSTCGLGWEVKTRTVVRQPENGGALCPRRLKRTRRCGRPC